MKVILNDDRILEAEDLKAVKVQYDRYGGISYVKVLNLVLMVN